VTPWAHPGTHQSARLLASHNPPRCTTHLQDIHAASIISLCCVLLRVPHALLRLASLTSRNLVLTTFYFTSPGCWLLLCALLLLLLHLLPGPPSVPFPSPVHCTWLALHYFNTLRPLSAPHRDHGTHPHYIQFLPSCIRRPRCLCLTRTTLCNSYNF
jgi:hypothetical protein